MPRFATIIAVMSLACSAAAYGWSGSFLRPPSGVTILATKIAEEKGDLARARNEYATAVLYYEKALRNNRQDSGLYNKLGIAEFKLGDRKAARKNFNQAIKYDPHNANAFNNLGALSVVEKKYKPAVRELKQALALDESIASAHLNIAEAWLGLKEVDYAMAEYARALELDADILNSSGDGVVAQVSTPEQRARVDYLIAEAYAKRGNVDGALEYLRRAKESGYQKMSDVYTEQVFAPLWQDARLQKIVKK